MAFSDLVVRPGVGVVYKLDISFDNFDTISARYSTHSGIDPSSEYDDRLLAVGNFTRALGMDHTFQTGSIEIIIANHDEVADWMVDRSNFVDVMKTRLRLYIGVYDPAAPSTIEWKQLGEFVFSEFPTRTDGQVRAILSDDTAGFIHQAVVRPTVGNWLNAEGLFGIIGVESPLRGGTLPIPLAFGDDFVEAIRGRANPIDSGPHAGAVPFAVCCTASTAAVTANDVTELWVGDIVTSNGQREVVSAPAQVPSTYTSKLSGQTVNVWTVHKTGPIAVDGRDFYVLWVAIHGEGYMSWLIDFLGGTSLPGAVLPPTAPVSALTEGLGRVWVKGYPYSAVTAINQAKQNPADIVMDLVSYYSKGSSANVNTASLARLKAAYDYSAAGIIGGNGNDSSLADHLSDLAASFEMDVFVGWDGKVSMSAALRDFEALTSVDDLPEFDETQIEMEADGIPSREQRGAPFNRIVKRDVRQGLRAAEPGYVSHEGIELDDPANTQRRTAWNRIIPRDLSIRWWSEDDRSNNPWFVLGLDTTPRPRVRFRTTLDALLLELGDYFRLTWTRNLGDPYERTIFQVESLTLHPDTNTVTVEAIWAGDLEEDRPYILDNETLLKKATGSGLRTVTVTQGDSIVTFSSGDLTSDGVERGDHLIIRDSSEGAASFKRFKALVIAEIVSATSAKVLDLLDSLDFGLPVSGSTAISDWEIRRSHVTYPTSLSDPVNYVDGGNVYGRVSNADQGGRYSDFGTGGFTSGHKLLDG